MIVNPSINELQAVHDAGTGRASWINEPFLRVIELQFEYKRPEDAA